MGGCISDRTLACARTRPLPANHPPAAPPRIRAANEDFEPTRQFGEDPRFEIPGSPPQLEQAGDYIPMHERAPFPRGKGTHNGMRKRVSLADS